MARRKRGTPEQQARRALISELLSTANVQSIPYRFQMHYPANKKTITLLSFFYWLFR